MKRSLGRIQVVGLSLLFLALACNMPGAGAPANSPATQVWATMQVALTQTAVVNASAFYLQHTQAAETLQAGKYTQVVQLTQAAQVTPSVGAWPASPTAPIFPTAAVIVPPTVVVVPPTQRPPAPTALPAAGRIRFGRGATSGLVEGALRRGEALEYLIAAGANQTLLASVSSSANDVTLGVSGADGNILQTPYQGSANYTGPLPGAQDYRLTVYAPNQASNFILQAIIPARIQFAPGAIASVTPGYLPGGQVNYYQAWARAGQRMTVNLRSPNNDVFLTIYGLSDGSPLVRSVMAQSSWSDVLNATQDYMIQAVSTGGEANYSLEVIIQ